MFAEESSASFKLGSSLELEDLLAELIYEKHLLAENKESACRTCSDE